MLRASRGARLLENGAAQIEITRCARMAARVMHVKPTAKIKVRPGLSRQEAFFFAFRIARRAPWDAYIDLSTRGALDLTSRGGHSGTVPPVTLPSQSHAHTQRNAGSVHIVMPCRDGA